MGENLVENEELMEYALLDKKFLSNFDLEKTLIENLLQYCMMLYNKVVNSQKLYESNGNIMGLKFDDIESTIISHFEKLDFNEKLDIFSEIFIRYDNETYFKNINNVGVNITLDGYTIANLIQKLKINL